MQPAQADQSGLSLRSRTATSARCLRHRRRDSTPRRACEREGRFPTIGNRESGDQRRLRRISTCADRRLDRPRMKRAPSVTIHRDRLTKDHTSTAQPPYILHRSHHHNRCCESRGHIQPLRLSSANRTQGNPLRGRDHHRSGTRRLCTTPESPRPRRARRSHGRMR